MRLAQCTWQLFWDKSIGGCLQAVVGLVVFMASAVSSALQRIHPCCCNTITALQNPIHNHQTITPLSLPPLLGGQRYPSDSCASICRRSAGCRGSHPTVWYLSPVPRWMHLPSTAHKRGTRRLHQQKFNTAGERAHLPQRNQVNPSAVPGRLWGRNPRRWFCGALVAFLGSDTEQPWETRPCRSRSSCRRRAYRWWRWRLMSKFPQWRSARPVYHFTIKCLFIWNENNTITIIYYYITIYRKHPSQLFIARNNYEALFYSVENPAHLPVDPGFSGAAVAHQRCWDVWLTLFSANQKSDIRNVNWRERRETVVQLSLAPNANIKPTVAYCRVDFYILYIRRDYICFIQLSLFLVSAKINLSPLRSALKSNLRGTGTNNPDQGEICWLLIQNHL